MRVKSLIASLATMFVSFLGCQGLRRRISHARPGYPKPRSRSPVRAQSRRLQNGRKPSFPGKQGQYQVGRGTELPCPNPAAVEIRGVSFCTWCAREQEAYFTVGEITQEMSDDRTGRAHNSLDGPLVEVLDRMRWGFDERLDEAEEYAEAVK